MQNIAILCVINFMRHSTKIANTCYILILLEDTSSTIYIENHREATYIMLYANFLIIAM